METNWYLITGSPSSGKTTVVNELQKRGYNTLPEYATTVIENELKTGKTLEEVRFGDIAGLQRKMLKMQLDEQAKLDPKELYFMDRGIPDIFVFHFFYKITQHKKLDWELYHELKNLAKHIKFKKVFLFDTLPLKKNNVRIENENDIEMLHRLSDVLYKDMGFEVINVPPMSVEERVNFVLKSIG